MEVPTFRIPPEDKTIKEILGSLTKQFQDALKIMQGHAESALREMEIAKNKTIAKFEQAPAEPFLNMKRSIWKR